MLSFNLHVSDFQLRSVGKLIEFTSSVILHTHCEGNKINFTLELYPDEKSYKNIDSLTQTMDGLVMHGKPWGYADRKTQFKNLPENPEKIIFWANEMELTILPKTLGFKKLVGILRN